MSISLSGRRKKARSIANFSNSINSFSWFPSVYTLVRNSFCLGFASSKVSVNNFKEISNFFNKILFETFVTSLPTEAMKQS